MLGIQNHDVRFFVYDCEKEGDNEIMEVTEQEFELCDYPISYERHTIFENGCAQICLTKMPIG